MKDRISSKPGRYILTPDETVSNAVFLEIADEPLEEGTPLNKKTLLQDRTARAIGLGGDPTVDDALLGLRGLAKARSRVIVGGNGWTEYDVDFLCTGENDAEVFAQAIESLPENGGEIIVLDGTYKINNPISLSRDFVSIRGSGRSTIFTGSAEELLQVFGAYQSIRNIFFSDCKTAIYIGGRSDSQNSFGCSVEDCSFLEATTGIDITSSENRVLGNNFFNCKNGVSIKNSKNVLVSNNHSTKCLSGFVNVTSSTDCVIANNTIESSNVTAAGSRISVNSNSFYAGGIYFWNCESMSAVGNMFYQVAGSGVDNSCIDLEGAKKCLISSNTIITNNGKSIYLLSSDGATCENNLVTGNMIYGANVSVSGGSNNTVDNNKYN